MKNPNCQYFSVVKMGAEIISGLLDSIRKATSERWEYWMETKAAFEGKGMKMTGYYGIILTFYKGVLWQQQIRLSP